MYVEAELGTAPLQLICLMQLHIHIISFFFPSYLPNLIWAYFLCFIDFAQIPASFLVIALPVINETLDEVSVSTTFVQSRLVSVSTMTEIPSLAESRSPKPQNFPVLMSLSLDNHIVYESNLPISIKYSFLPTILI